MTVLISLLGTSKRRPIKVANATQPDVIYLVKSSSPDWKDHTSKIALDVAKEIKLVSAKKLKINTVEANMIDFDNVFKTIYDLIIKSRKQKNNKNTIHVDVSATTGIAMASSILASCLFEDTHIHYIHSIFNPQNIQSFIKEEDDPKKAAGQHIIEIPKPMVPIFSTQKGEIYKKCLLILHDKEGSISSSSALMEKLGLSRATRHSAPSTVSAYVKSLRKWGLVEKFREKGNSEEIRLTKFGESLAKVLSNS